MKKWIFRALFLIVVAIGSSLMVLSIVSGRSDMHREGLEQAFSGAFGGQAHIGTLRWFNFFPQLAIDVGNVDVAHIKGGGPLHIENLQLGFSALDLFFERRTISTFHLKNLELPSGTYLPLVFKIADATIERGPDVGAARFSFYGFYNGRILDGQVSMVPRSDRFAFAEQNPFIINVGVIQASGQFSPYSVSGGEILGLTFTAIAHDKMLVCKLPELIKMPSATFFNKVVTGLSAVNDEDSFHALCHNLNGE